jgi:hypothetical protein
LPVQPKEKSEDIFKGCRPTCDCSKKKLSIAASLAIPCILRTQQRRPTERNCSLQQVQAGCLTCVRDARCKDDFRQKLRLFWSDERNHTLSIGRRQQMMNKYRSVAVQCIRAAPCTDTARRAACVPVYRFSSADTNDSARPIGRTHIHDKQSMVDYHAHSSVHVQLGV